MIQAHCCSYITEATKHEEYCKTTGEEGGGKMKAKEEQQARLERMKGRGGVGEEGMRGEGSSSMVEEGCS